MKENLKTLIELQQVESEAATVKSKLSIVSHLIEGFDASVTDSEKGLQAIQERLAELQKQYRLHESDIQLNLSRIKKSREKLGAVKNNKEYQSILKEIEDMQAKNSLVEDEMIAVLEQIESVEREIQSQRSETEKIKTQADMEKTAIQEDAFRNQQRLAQLEKKAGEISLRAEPELLRKYRLVKEQTRGVAIAAVHNAVCQGCNLNIPPQMYNELQRYQSLTMCPHCQRIIYWAETK